MHQRLPLPQTQKPTALELNPFAILGATTRDDRQRIVELADEQSLRFDPTLCAEARETLNNPRKRLGAEIAWLPGLSPRHASDAFTLLRHDPTHLLNPGDDHALARANLVASVLELLKPNLPADTWIAWIVKLAELADLISGADVRRDLNEDRGISRFPLIASMESVEEEISHRKSAFQEAVIRACERLPTLKLVEVATGAVTRTTNNGQKHGPSLIHDIADAYEVQALGYLRQEADTILALVKAARDAISKGENAVAAYLDRINALLDRWQEVAKPVRISKISRGLKHETSLEIARELRDVAIEAVNNHGELETSDRILRGLKTTFADMPEFAARIETDAQTLSDLFKRREQHGKEQETWKREIAFACDIGTIFKKRLSITADEIHWNGDVYPLSSINRIRWGATRHSVNFVPTGTTYHIEFGSSSRYATLDTNEFVYREFTSRLWKTVGARLATEMVNALGRGDKFRFGSAVITDTGVEFTKSGLFSGNEVIFAAWSDIKIWNSNGNFVIGTEKPKRATVVLSYQGIDNVHALETVIRVFFKSGASRVSESFGNVTTP
jgi:hypothetical protein